MGIPIRNRRHISVEILSEYLDGRLPSSEGQRVERHIEGCSKCGHELRSMEHTIGLLRQTPVLNPRRSFTLREAPYPARRGWATGVPAWAYGAAASVAVALFAVTLSLDLGGSLASDVDRQEPSPEAVEAPLPSAATLQQAPVPEDQGRQVGREAPSVPEPVAAQALRETSAEAPQAAPAPVPAPETAAAAVQAESPVVGDAPPPEAPPGRTEPEAEASEERAPLPIQADAPPLAETPRGTSLVWHIVEGVSSGAALILVGLLLRRMRRHRNPPAA